MLISEREDPDDYRMASFFEREHDHVLKLAMVLAASKGELFRSNVVNSERIRESIRMMEEVKKDV